MSRSIQSSLALFRETLKTVMEKTPDLRADFESIELRDAYFENIQSYKETLQKRFDRFKEYFDKLVDFRSDQIDEEERTKIEEIIEADAVLIARFDGLIIDMENDLRRIRQQHAVEEKNKEKEARQIRIVGFRESREEAVASERPNAKLPKLELMKFDGNIKRWQEFWDSFQSSVHTNRSLSPIDKMNYLKVQLTGDAKEAISGLACTSDNYSAAVALLTKRFGNKQAIIDSHYHFLTNLAAAANQTSSLRSVFDSLEQTLFSLEALGESIDHRQFVSIIKSKLPWPVIVNLEEKKGGLDWTVQNLREQLNQYIAARESAEMTTASNSKFDKTKNGNDHSKIKFSSGKSNTTTIGALFSNDRSTNSKFARCAYCHEGHWSDQCLAYPTIDTRKAKIKGNCFLCLKKDHMMSDCWLEKPCHYCKKRKSHHQSLCPDKFSNKRKAEVVATTPNKRKKLNQETDQRVIVSSKSVGEQTSTTMTSTVQNSLLSVGEAVYLQTASATVCSPNSEKSIKIRLLMDSGSHRSYVSSELSKRLRLKSTPEGSLSLYTFGSKKAKEIPYSIVDLKLQLIDGSIFTLSANVIDSITGPVQQPPINFDRFQPIIKTLVLADQEISNDTTIDLLIGSDYYSDIMTGDKIELSQGLYLLGSKLGWILNGRQKTVHKQNFTSTALLIATKFMPDEGNSPFVSADSQITEKFDMQKFWDLDTIGIKDKENDLGDAEALKNFNDAVQYSDNRYYVTWPWKNSEIDLPSNFQLSLGRLSSLLSRYKDQPDVFDSYQSVLDSQLEKGIIEKVDYDSNSDLRKHYIPHHGVITPEKTTKLRIVYDGSAKAKKGNKSINECLYRGPVLLEDLCGLLIRFRLNPIALIADIEKAFLQVGLQEADRDVTRFLWLRDPKLMTTKDNLQIYRFMRVPFGIISSPFLLAATIAYHLQKDGSAAAVNILKNLYVDNMITGVDSSEAAITFYEKAKALFSSASMNLRGWASNSKTFIDSLPPNDRAIDTSVKVLGLNWNTDNDELSIGLITDLPSVITKRTVLKFTASLFDPLGLFSPTVLLAKLFLQKLWLDKYDWDDSLPDDLTSKWQSITTDITPLFNLKVPRFIGANSETKLRRLHCFCDASKHAYGISIYLQTISDLSISVDLLFAKARLAPIRELTLPSSKQEITLPRLELLAVHIGSKCIDFVRRHLPFCIDQTFVWSDSQCVLQWLNSNKPLDVFVRNRVAAIKKVSDLSFRYVPSADNPADLSSRGQSATVLISNSFWWHGPSFLRIADPVSWPSMDFLSKKPDSSIPEKSILFSSSCLVSEGASNAKNKRASEEITDKDFTSSDPESPLGIDINRFSSFTKLLRVTALAMRFIDRIRKKKVKPLSVGSEPLSAVEINSAKILWIKHSQQKHFSEVFRAIGKNDRHPIRKQFDLWIDQDGLLRCGGRLSNSDLSELSMHPILLPKKEQFTNLIIQNYHRKLFHVGVSHTLAEIRKEYWIPSGRSEVYKLIRKCIDCKKFDGGPYKLPLMAPLPKSRVTPSAPFTATGLDYIGPLFVKSIGANNRKVWICLFTCLSTRAIHLELIDDQSAEQFLLCLQRFIARRGKPSVIISDNAKQFKLVSSVIEKTWRKIIGDHLVTTYISAEGIKWKYITERAPWQGGFYERLVGLVKQCLKKSIGRICLTFLQLQTIVTQIEAVLNSRPLVYVGSDFETGQLITPAHFLSLNVKTGIPVLEMPDLDDPDFVDKVSSKDQLVKFWKKGQRHLEQFWKLWQDDYLLSLRQRHQSDIKQPRVRAANCPKVGDIVLMRNEGPRGTWKLAKIVELITSADGEIRSAKVVSSNGTFFNRSLMHLFPLETDVATDQTVQDNLLDQVALPQDIDPSLDLGAGSDSDQEVEF